MADKENRQQLAKGNLLWKASERPFNPQLLLKTHEQPKMLDSMSFSLEKQCMGSSKSSAIFLNQPITHNNPQPSTHSTTTTSCSKNRYCSRQPKPSPKPQQFLSNKTTCTDRPQKPQYSTSKFIEMKVRCKELEFECESLRECLREYQGREVTGDQWRMNKLKESHEKVNELSQQVETMTMEMQAVRAEKGRLEGELGRAKEELAKMHAVVQEKQNLVSRQEVGHKEAIQKLKTEHKQQINRHMTRQQSITCQLQTLKSKQVTVTQQCQSLRKQHTHLQSSLTSSQSLLTKLTQQSSASLRSLQLQLQSSQSQTAQLKSLQVLNQAKCSSENKALKCDYDGLLAVLKVKEECIEELKGRLKAQGNKYEEQIRRLRERVQTSEGREKEREYEVGVKEEGMVMRHREMQYTVHEMAAIIDEMKAENKVLFEQNMIVEKDIAVALAKIETLERSLNARTDQVKSLQLERNHLMQKLSQIAVTDKMLQQTHRSIKDLPCSNNPPSILLHPHKKRLSTQYQPLLDYSTIERRKSSSKHRANSLTKLRHCDTAIPYSQRHPPHYVQQQQEQSINQAILRRCKVIVGSARYG